MVYVSVNEAVEIAEEYIGECEFLKLDEKKQLGLLKRSTANINCLSHIGLGLGYKGNRSDENQKNEFPRDFQTEIPLNVKLACVVEATVIADNSNVHRLNLRRQGVTNITIGSVKETYSKLEKSDNVISREALIYLLPYINKGQAVGIK